MRLGTAATDQARPPGTRALDAVLLGESMDMAHALRAAGARTTVVAGPHAPARYSRRDLRWVEDPRPGDAQLVEKLVALGDHDGAALFYETDVDLLFVSRHREALAPAMRMLLPSPTLLDQLVDKSSFGQLAAQLDLPVPSSWTVSTTGQPPQLDAPYPRLVKPLVRDARWSRGQKAVLVRDAEELEVLLQSLAPSHRSLIVQCYIPGPESAIESYHVYVDPSGEVAAEFTGRKIRTLPAQNGYSTALVTTDAEDVRALGRDVVRALGLVGVAKLDLKRDGEGRLWLLEVNPRFNLWHHLGAAAGVNIPEVVLADLSGCPRPPTVRARAGLTWCNIPKDLAAARGSGVGTREWFRWVRGCDTSTGLDVADPLPFVAGQLWPRLLEQAGRHRAAPAAATSGG